MPQPNQQSGGLPSFLSDLRVRLADTVSNAEDTALAAGDKYVAQPMMKVANAANQLIDIPVSGAQEFAQAVDDLGRGPSSGTPATVAAHNAIQGSMKAGTVLLPEAAATAPLELATGLITGTAGQQLGEKGATALGATPEQAQLAGDVTGIASGGVGAIERPEGSAFADNPEAGVLKVGMNAPEEESGMNDIRWRKPEDVMVKPQETSRATPTGEKSSLPPEVHADLEKQAGRPLSDEEAVSLDRANLERGMVSAPEGNTNQIREEKRSQLEKPREYQRQQPPTQEKRAGPNPVSKVSEETPETESKPAEDNVMVQPQKTSRATPTGATSSLPAELHADLEKQAGRKLSDAEAVALDRSNLEEKMVSTPAGDTNQIREAKRSELEQPREAEKKSPQQIIEDQGLKYKGELVKGSGVHMFEHPDHPGKTASMEESNITPQSIKDKMASKLKDFGVSPKGKTKRSKLKGTEGLAGSR